MQQTTLARNMHLTLLRLRGTIARGSNKTVETAWREVLRVPDSDARLYEALWLIVEALNRLEHQVMECPALHDGRKVHLENIGHWKSVFSPSVLPSLIESHADRLSDLRLNHLVHLGDTLRLVYEENTFDDEELAYIKKHTTRLIGFVDRSKLDERLKAFIMEQLERVSLAVDNARYLGLDGVHEVAFSAMARTGVELGRAPEEERKRPIVRRAFGIGKHFIRFMDATAAANRWMGSVEDWTGRIQALLSSVGGD